MPAVYQSWKYTGNDVPVCVALRLSIWSAHRRMSKLLHGMHSAVEVTIIYLPEDVACTAGTYVIRKADQGIELFLCKMAICDALSHGIRCHVNALVQISNHVLIANWRLQLCRSARS
jgi:hypothetical protein